MVKREEPDDVWGAQTSDAAQSLTDDDGAVMSIQQWGVRGTLAPPWPLSVWAGDVLGVGSIVRVRLSFSSGEEMDTLF